MIAGLTTPQLLELVLLLLVTGALAGFLAGIFGMGAGLSICHAQTCSGHPDD